MSTGRALAGRTFRGTIRGMVLALALALLVADPAPLAEEVAVGSLAPEFSLRTLNAEACGAPWVRLANLVGPRAEDPLSRLVLISFFASWCEPCKRELPLLARLDREYRAAGLRVVSVDIDGEEPGIEAARKLAAEAGLTHPVGSDRFNLLARRYLGEQAPLPSVFLIRRDGTIARIERGYAGEAAAFLSLAVQSELKQSSQGGPAATEIASPQRR